MQKNIIAQDTDEQRPILEAIPSQGDENSGGSIFGGWTLSHMDVAAGRCAYKWAKQRITTIGVDKMRFLKPIFKDDVVSFFANVVETGTTSMAIQVDVFAQRQDNDTQINVAQGVFSFVALDQNGRPVALQNKLQKGSK